MPINKIENDTGGELKLFDPSGATIGKIPSENSGGPFPITIVSIAVDDVAYNRKLGLFENDSSYKAELENIPDPNLGFKVVFWSKDAAEVTFTQ